METIEKGTKIYEIRFPHIREYEIERVIETDGVLYAEVLVGFHKDQSKLIKLDSEYTGLNLLELREQFDNRVEKCFDMAQRRFFRDTSR